MSSWYSPANSCRALWVTLPPAWPEVLAVLLCMKWLSWAACQPPHFFREHNLNIVDHSPSHPPSHRCDIKMGSKVGLVSAIPLP